MNVLRCQCGATQLTVLTDVERSRYRIVCPKDGLILANIRP